MNGQSWSVRKRKIIAIWLYFRSVCHAAYVGVSSARKQGNYILTGTDGLLSVPIKTLPLDPAARFARLFALKPRWKPEEMKPVRLSQLLFVCPDFPIVPARHSSERQGTGEVDTEECPESERGQRNCLRITIETNT